MFERRCVDCRKFSTVEVIGSLTHGDFGACPFCGGPFGPLGLGDRLISGDAVELVDPKTHGKRKAVPPAEEPKLPAPGPGEQGYRPVDPRRSA